LLSGAEKARYRAAYCGLCRRLRDYGPEGRAELSYDMTFIALLLNSVYEPAEEHGEERCLMRPVPVHKYFVSEATEYAAAMNILLAYYNELDDWKDEGDRNALARGKKLERYLPDIERKWPAQAARAAECMQRLAELEQANCLNPDEPANCFAALMGEILDWKGESRAVESRTTESRTGDPSAARRPSAEDAPGASPGVLPGAGLRRMGEALGRFLYLLDASNDLRDDIRNERYNPLVAQTGMDFERLLTLMISECTGEFEKLNPKRDIHLLRNVLYSGVWMRYRRRKKIAGAFDAADASGAASAAASDSEDLRAVSDSAAPAASAADAAEFVAPCKTSDSPGEGPDDD